MMHLIMQLMLNEALLVYKQEGSPLSHAAAADGTASTGNW